jgi:hypothetical protein
VKKFKKGLALSLALAMGLSLCACGGDDATTTEAPATDAPADTTEAAADTTEAAAESATMAAPGTDGEKIYVYSWNEELGGIINDEFLAKYPEYTDLVEYVNLGVGGTSDEYKTQLETLVTGAGDKYPSIIAMDNDVALYFMSSDFVIPVSEVGITDAMYANAYQYTKDYATIDGQMKGVSWQGTPGCFTFRADIAKEVLGTDDPAEVQEYVKDWDTFLTTAQTMKDKGYAMISGTDDLKYAMIDQKTSPWVVDDKLNIDKAVTDYLEMAKKMYDGGFTNKTTQWDDAWASGFDGNVFGYFGCTWFVYWSISAEEHAGDYRVCPGPVDYHWGGTYLAATKDCPNKELAGFIMYTLCCDSDFMYAHMAAKSDFVNNKVAVQTAIDNKVGASDMLGGQNPVETWAAQCDLISLKYATQYDSTFNGYMDAAASAYNSGEAATIEDAIEIIKSKVRESYTYITVE